MRANLWSRTASRVLVRVAEFKAKAFFELELNAKKVPWKRFVPQGGTAEFRVTARKSPIHSLVPLFTCEPVRTPVNIDVSQCWTCEVDL